MSMCTQKCPALQLLLLYLRIIKLILKAMKNLLSISKGTQPTHRTMSWFILALITKLISRLMIIIKCFLASINKSCVNNTLVSKLYYTTRINKLLFNIIIDMIFCHSMLGKTAVN